MPRSLLFEAGTLIPSDEQLVPTSSHCYSRLQPLRQRLMLKPRIFPGSSMVEQEAVNFEVASSSLAPGARCKSTHKDRVPMTGLFCLFYLC